MNRWTHVYFLGDCIVSYLNKGLLGVGVVLTSLSLLTACQTVEGTVLGAGKGAAADVRSVDNAMTPEAKKKAAVHHKAHHKAHHATKHHHKAHHAATKSKKADEQSEAAPKEGTNDVTLGS